MLKSIEMQGRTEEEAIELALEKLKLTRDDVSVEVLETAKSGLFGLKNTPATVKVEYESDEAEEIEDAVPVAKEKDAGHPAKADKNKKKSSEPAKTAPAKTAHEKTAPAKPAVIDDELTGRIDSYLKGLFERMGLEVSLNIFEKDGNVGVTLTSSDPGVLIGRRGETLDALQHLTNYSINRSVAGRVRVHLDAENYRQRRSESLESLAARTASKVIKYRRNMTLDPMNAYERHIIHAALQDNDQVSTFSVGNESNRRVVVAYGQSKTASERADSPQYKEWH